MIVASRLTLSAAILYTLSLSAQAQSVDIPALVRGMTLEEKISLLHGTVDPRELGGAGYWPGLPRLGIPPLRFADGPPGVNVTKVATAMPAPVGLAATFDREAARLYGAVLGREAKALDQDVLLAPHIDIVRDPLYRRNHTTLGEDPLLNALLGAAEIAGIQSQGVMAQVKHLGAYNGSDNVVIDERTLHELYLPMFEAAVDARVASIMCAYSKVNGVWSCEDNGLQNDLLRKRWGFQGFVTSDWGAVHTPFAITRGLDLEMPGRPIAFRGGPVFREDLRPLVEKGIVAEAIVDRAVTRILGEMNRRGLLNRKRSAGTARLDIEASAGAARSIAAQSAVLLKNESNSLPLSADDLGSLVVIGPTGGQLAAGFLGERGAGFESRMVSPLAALRRTAPKAKIAYSAGNDLTGVPIPGSALAGNGRPGLLRRQIIPETGATQIDEVVNFDGRTALKPGTEYSWTGTLSVPREGEYTLMLQAGGLKGADGGGSITIDGNPILRVGPVWGGSVVVKKWSSLLPTVDGRDNARATLHLTSGPHSIELTANSTGAAPLSIRFAWMTPELREKNIAAAVAAARKARTAVIFAWNGTGGSFSLPEGQDELIERVAAVNPRTIVVLNTGSPVAMPWKDRVRAILEMWYPGQEGGWATADILLGRFNPSGRLPVTFPVKLEDCPTREPGHPERLGVPSMPGGAGGLVADLLGRLLGGPSSGAETFAATYSEGLAVGYRWFDQRNIQPLFPFGHGLSYTRFEYSDLAIERDGDGFTASFTLRNAGSRKGSEVAQLYLGPAENAEVPMMPRSLAGFEPMELEPGRSQTVAVRITARSLSYWSTARQDWVLATGSRKVYVGASSRDIRLEGTTPPLLSSWR